MTWSQMPMVNCQCARQAWPKRLLFRRYFWRFGLPLTPGDLPDLAAPIPPASFALRAISRLPTTASASVLCSWAVSMT